MPSDTGTDQHRKPEQEGQPEPYHAFGPQCQVKRPVYFPLLFFRSTFAAFSAFAASFFACSTQKFYALRITHMGSKAPPGQWHGEKP